MNTTEFIPRTDDEIIARIEEREKDDILGFERADLLRCLPLEKARVFLKEDSIIKSWQQDLRTRDAVALRIAEYMPFAWEKANKCRGISAYRSLCHMRAWLWLLREPVDEIQFDDYSHYGKPQLREICEHMGIRWENLDDGMWRNSEDGTHVPPDAVPRANLWRQG